MNKIPLGFLVAGASIAAFNLLHKLTNSFASLDMTDAIALMVLAGASKMVLIGWNRET